MKDNEDSEVNVVLETVTSTIRSLTDLVQACVGSIGKHTEALDTQVSINDIQDGKIRTLEAKVYALEQDMKEMREDFLAMIRSYQTHDHPHGHSRLVGEP